ncbi:hypothetical protein MRB53_041395 [Persea americana]|nr:hypothetical protein MRB53_041395 [Persea americana]
MSRGNVSSPPTAQLTMASRASLILLRVLCTALAMFFRKAVRGGRSGGPGRRSCEAAECTLGCALSTVSSVVEPSRLQYISRIRVRLLIKAALLSFLDLSSGLAAIASCAYVACFLTIAGRTSRCEAICFRSLASFNRRPTNLVTSARDSPAGTTPLSGKDVLRNLICLRNVFRKLNLRAEPASLGKKRNRVGGGGILRTVRREVVADRSSDALLTCSASST